MSNGLKKILVVDDSTTNNLLFQHLLEEEGYRVLISETGKDALKRTVDDRPDLVLLDIMLPGFDGFQVLEYLKKDKITENIPVVMVTAKKDTWSMKKSLDLGAIDYVVKPIEINNFLNKISRILNA